MTSSSLPQWLSKQSSDSYLLSALKTLASREDERESARRLSVQQEPESDSSTSSTSRFMALNRIFRSSGSSQHRQTSNAALRNHYSVAIGCHPNNQARNRYMDIQPYDRTRVVVSDNRVANEQVSEGQHGGKEGQYLNASWVLERCGHKWWIASQAPLPNTAHSFLSLFFHPVSPPASHNDSSSQPKSRIRTVVQLTNEIEGGRRKAHPYFPGSIGHSVIIQPERDDGRLPFKVTLLDRETIDTAQCILSTVSIAPILPPPHGPDASQTEVIKGDNMEHQGDSTGETEGSIIFRHMLYTAWPDHGVPKANNRASLLAFMQLVDSKNRDVSLTSTPEDSEVDLDPPIVVGCSAGIGRTGSFIAMSSLLRHYDFLPKPSTPSDPSVIPPSPLGAIPLEMSDDLVVQEIDWLREQRPRMVERNEQVILIYEMLTSVFNSN